MLYKEHWKMIALDGILTEIFKRQAYFEGITRTKRLDQLWSDADKGGFVQPAIDNRELVQEALASMVLFGGVTLDVRVSRSIEILEKAIDFPGINENVRSPAQGLDYAPLIDLGIVDVQQIEDLKDTYNTRLFEELCPFFRDYVLRKASLTGEYLGELKIFGLEKAMELVLESIRRSTGGIQMPRSRLFHEVLLDSELSHDRAYQQGSFLMEKIWGAYKSFEFLHESVTAKGLYAKTSTQKCSTKYLTNEKIDNTYNVYEIILDEVITFPRPRTIKSAIKLLNDPNVIAFREVLNQWTQALMEDPKNSEKLRLEIRKAKKSLERLKTYKKAGRIMTFVSSSVGIAGAFVGLPLGLAITPVGLAMTADSIRRERQHKWMFFGSS